MRFKISKDGGSYEQLHKQTLHAVRDIVWFSENLPRLRKDFMNKWVAVRSGKVIDSDADRQRLVARLSEMEDKGRSAQVFLVEPAEVIHLY